jgi:aminoglycoside phosphotransferase (APT) family kinase protein
LLTDLSTAPKTLLHGDYRADNILFRPDGSVVLLDFQLIGTGSAAYDLAYFVTQSLDAAVASANERALFDRWIAGLHAAGVTDTDRMWDDYRKAALFCLVYPVVASRGMDLADPRQRGLIDCMNSRLCRAIDELDLAGLLG